MADSELIFKVQNVLQDKNGFADISNHNVKRAIILVLDAVEDHVVKRKKKPPNAYEKIVKDFRILHEL